MKNKKSLAGICFIILLTGSIFLTGCCHLCHRKHHCCTEEKHHYHEGKKCYNPECKYKKDDKMKKEVKEEKVDME